MSSAIEVTTQFGEKLNPARTHKMHSKFRGERQVVRLTNNPSEIGPGQELYLRFPTLGSSDVIVPLSVRVGFDLSLSKGSTPVNNIARNIVDSIKVSIDGQEIYSLNDSDVFYSYVEQWMTKEMKKEISYDHGIIEESVVQFKKPD